MVHLLSFIVLVLKINATKSCRGRCVQPMPKRRTMTLPCRQVERVVDAPPGISLKTQELYTLVFVCRYLDLFTNFVSMCVTDPWHACRPHAVRSIRIC